MNARKLLATAAAAATVMGSIGIAYAQNDAPMNPPTAANTGPGTNNMTGSNTAMPNANTPATPNTAPTYNTPTPNTQSTAATDSMPAPQADRG